MHNYKSFLLCIELPSTSGDDPLEIISKLDDNEKITSKINEYDLCVV